MSNFGFQNLQLDILTFLDKNKQTKKHYSTLSHVLLWYIKFIHSIICWLIIKIMTQNTILGWIRNQKWTKALKFIESILYFLFEKV